VIFLTNSDVQQALTMKDCIRVLEEGELEQARGELVARPRIDVITSDRDVSPGHQGLNRIERKGDESYP